MGQVLLGFTYDGVHGGVFSNVYLRLTLVTPHD